MNDKYWYIRLIIWIGLLFLIGAILVASSTWAVGIGVQSFMDVLE